MTDKSIEVDNFKDTSLYVIYISVIIQVMLSMIVILMVFDSYDFWLLVISVSFIVFRNINQHLVTVASVENDTFTYNFLSLVGPVLGLIIGFVLLYIFDDNAIYPLVGFGFAELIGLSYITYLKRRNIRKLRINFAIIKDGFKYGLPLVLAGLLSWLGLNSSRYILEGIMGLSAVGFFAVGFGLGQRAASMASMIVTSAALPLAIRVTNESGLNAGVRQLSDNFCLLFCVLLPSLVGMFLVQEDLVMLFISEDFVQDTLVVLPWSILSGGLFAIIYNYLNHYFILAKKTYFLIYIDGALALLVILFSFVLINMYGVVGAAMSMSLASLVLIIALMFYLILNTGFVVPWFFMLKTLASVVLMGGFISQYGVTNFSILVNLFLNIVSGAFVYVFSMLLLNRSAFLLAIKSRGY
ncbi:polysaccharide biosynthesis C-terminal domain-containing protein [Shewanella gaetbuli]|uniref:Polysaccharide biosynthesis C-terminal domain-containing protein n=1 Tax=Shewanella gaetbuli TaxID=220752 RepID=A0A9X2CKM8_9GAMM|nr:polysaccharide biosynthesis C-terminal domain-containing protein [Shewanella gaetbuli]MCL1143251.1 polysaccharide biosynthesis C-terminal domain-containing protein [Shewanella gaetbuli]